ncbi:C39 family peptidase [Massilia soli]|uniref:C39 family peptidase n=1 Tax=Massilia soli TaxID=2792854 RepID=A0ABS7SKC6_9BURK|nr:C39 family peptidase [Massilia soli]MBZ2206635.1 C39 family peptidase [Massilia soli]
MRALRLCAGAALLSLAAQYSAHALDLALPGGARVQVPIAGIKQLRFSTTLRQQFDFSCGSAALATLLTHHYGHPVTEQLVFERMFMRGDQARIRKQGFSLLDMQRFLAERGFRADGFQLPLQKLIDAQLPAIVLVSDKGYNHFVVIKGISGGRVLVGDPSSGARALSQAAFEAIWSNRLLFVIHGSTAAPAFNTVADWRSAPAAPLGQGIDRSSLAAVTMPKLGPGEF